MKRIGINEEYKIWMIGWNKAKCRSERRHEGRCKWMKNKRCTLFGWGSMAAHEECLPVGRVGVQVCAHERDGAGRDVTLGLWDVLWMPSLIPHPPTPPLHPPPLYTHAPGLQGTVDAVQWPQLSAPSPGLRSTAAACKAWSSLRSTCPFISEDEGRGEAEGEGVEKERGMFATCPSLTWIPSLAMHISPSSVSDWLLSSTSPILLQQTEGEEVEQGKSMGAGLSPDRPVNESHESSSSSGWSSCQPSSCSSCAKVRKPFVTTPGRWSSRAPIWGWASCCQAWRVAEPGKKKSEKC